jgi:hypothetical protein
MKVKESSLSAEILENIEGCAGDAVALLGLDTSRRPASVEKVLESINAFLLRSQKAKRKDATTYDDLSFNLGSLWGEQLVKSLKWEWVCLTILNKERSKAVAVVSPDRSLAILPFDFVYSCLADNTPVTILLAYNMIKDGTRIPHIGAGAYANVMEYVHHIVPPD